MLWAYTQQLDPLKDKVPWSPVWSTLLAAIPVLVLFWLLVPRRWLAPKAGAAGAAAAIVIAIIFYGMPADMAVWAFFYGVGFGLLPVGWTIFAAMLLYNITVETGHFTIVRRSVAELSGDARIQAVLIGFAFGAFLEGAAGGGTPVAICGAIMVGLGFDPFLAAVLCLIANTSPVAYGGLGTPLIVLNGVTDLPTETLSIMAGHQLPLLSFLVPLYMVKVMCSWKQTWEIWPALLVSGGSFALFQYTFATMHVHVPGLFLYPMTDIGGGIFSLVVTAIFLRFWKPRKEWHFGTSGQQSAVSDQRSAVSDPSCQQSAVSGQPESDGSSLTADRCTLTAPGSSLTAPGSSLTADRCALTAPSDEHKPLTIGNVSMAWAPFAIMSVMLMLTGLVRQQEGKGPVKIGSLQTNYMIPIPTLDRQSHRDARLHAMRAENLVCFALSSHDTLGALVNVPLVARRAPRAERAEFNFAWLTAPGTAVFLAALLSMLLLRMNLGQIGRVFQRTCIQMKIPIPTIACMLGLSYVTRYAGMDATLGIAFAGTGLLYPFFAPILGWLGVFLTGTDAGSNALFGSLQKITATEIFNPHAFPCSREQLQVLICTANSTGGVMGKMIDAQSICVATAATNQIGREADIFKAVIWHSIILASAVGLITLLQAYVYPLTGLVPTP